MCMRQIGSLLTITSCQISWFLQVGACPRAFEIAVASVQRHVYRIYGRPCSLATDGQVTWLALRLLHFWQPRLGVVGVLAALGFF